MYDTPERTNREALEMNQHKLSVWLKAIIIAVGICGLIVYFGILPEIGSTMTGTYPEFSSWHWPWMIFLWVTAVPCFAALFFGWRIAGNIGKDTYIKALNGISGFFDLGCHTADQRSSGFFLILLRVKICQINFQSAVANVKNADLIASV